MSDDPEGLIGEPPVAGSPSRRSLRFDSTITVATGLGVYGLAALTGPLLARNLGPAGRGDLASVLVPTEMIGWLLCFGIPHAAIYYSRRYAARQLVMASWAFAVVVGSAVVIAAWFFVPWYLRDHAAETIPWFRAFLVAAIVFAPVTTTVELLTARGAMVLFNVWRAFPLVVSSVAIVGLAIAGELTLPNALAASFIAKGLWFTGVIVTNRAWPGRGFRWGVLVDQLGYGIRVMVGAVSNVVVNRFDQFLLVGMVSPRSLGFYVVAATAAMFTGPISEGVAAAVFPRLVHADSDRRSHRTLGQAVRWTAAASVLVSVGIAALAPWAIPLFFGAAFTSSVTPLWVMLPGQCAANVAIVVSQRLKADNRPGAASMGLVVGALVTIVGLLIAVPPFGIMGAATVTTVAQFILLGYVSVALARGPRTSQPAPGLGEIDLPIS